MGLFSQLSHKKMWAVLGAGSLAGLGGIVGVNALDDSPEPSELDIPTCELDSLPEHASEVASTIRSDGPYAYPDNDDEHFGNYEGRLPAQDGDYYRKYTVDTPGLDHRGARRIITGGGAEPEVWYYTDDHYESFCEIPTPVN